MSACSLESGNIVSNESADEFVYEPLSRVCIPVNVTYPFFAAFSLWVLFDVAIIILTAYKVFRLASGLRKQSGAQVVRTFPSLIPCVVLIPSWVALHHIPGWYSVRTAVKERALRH